MSKLPNFDEEEYLQGLHLQVLYLTDEIEKVVGLMIERKNKIAFNDSLNHSIYLARINKINEGVRIVKNA